jgi:hypothetical protein
MVEAGERPSAHSTPQEQTDGPNLGSLLPSLIRRLHGPKTPPAGPPVIGLVLVALRDVHKFLV